MTKTTFIAAIQRATLAQNAFTGDKKYKQKLTAVWDVLYEDLCNESDEDVIAALKSIGKTNEVINYANIMRYVGENKKNREWGNRNKRKAKPQIEGSPGPKYEDMSPEVQKTIDTSGFPIML